MLSFINISYVINKKEHVHNVQRFVWYCDLLYLPSIFTKISK